MSKKRHLTKFRDLDAESIELNKKYKNLPWIDRYNKGNKLRTEFNESHRLSYADMDGKPYVYPLIIEEKGKLKRFNSHNEAIDYARKNKTLLPIKDTELADYYSKQGLIKHDLNSPMKYDFGIDFNTVQQTNQLRDNTMTQQETAYYNQQYDFGGWLGDNAGMIGSTLGTVGGAFIGMPGLGASVGGAIGGQLQTDPQAELLAQQQQQQSIKSSLAASQQANQTFQLGGGLNNITQYNGLQHQQGGLPLGNTGNEVEDGETRGIGRTEDYIYSDKLSPEGSKKTFADLSKEIEKKYKGSENDKFAIESKDKELDALATEQEQIKARKFQEDLANLQESNPEMFQQMMQSVQQQQQQQQQVQQQQLPEQQQVNAQQGNPNDIQQGQQQFASGGNLQQINTDLIGQGITDPPKDKPKIYTDKKEYETARKNRKVEYGKSISNFMDSYLIDNNSTSIPDKDYNKIRDIYIKDNPIDYSDFVYRRIVKNKSPEQIKYERSKKRIDQSYNSQIAQNVADRMKELPEATNDYFNPDTYNKIKEDYIKNNPVDYSSIGGIRKFYGGGELDPNLKNQFKAINNYSNTARPIDSSALGNVNMNNMNYQFNNPGAASLGSSGKVSGIPNNFGLDAGNILQQNQQNLRNDYTNSSKNLSNSFNNQSNTANTNSIEGYDNPEKPLTMSEAVNINSQQALNSLEVIGNVSTGIDNSLIGRSALAPLNKNLNNTTPNNNVTNNNMTDAKYDGGANNFVYDIYGNLTTQESADKLKEANNNNDVGINATDQFLQDVNNNLTPREQILKNSGTLNSPTIDRQQKMQQIWGNNPNYDVDIMQQRLNKNFPNLDITTIEDWRDASTYSDIKSWFKPDDIENFYNVYENLTGKPYKNEDGSRPTYEDIINVTEKSVRLSKDGKVPKGFGEGAVLNTDPMIAVFKAIKNNRDIPNSTTSNSGTRDRDLVDPIPSRGLTLQNPKEVIDLQGATGLNQSFDNVEQFNTRPFVGDYVTAGLSTLPNIGVGIGSAILGKNLNYDKANAEQYDPNFVDPTRAIQETRDQYAGAKDQIRQGSRGAGNYMSNLIGATASQSKNTASIQSKYDNINAGIANQSGQFNAQQRQRVGIYNTQVSNQEQQDKIGLYQNAIGSIGAGLNTGFTNYNNSKQDANMMNIAGGENYYYERMGSVLNQKPVRVVNAYGYETFKIPGKPTKFRNPFSGKTISHKEAKDIREKWIASNSEEAVKLEEEKVKNTNKKSNEEFKKKANKKSKKTN